MTQNSSPSQWKELLKEAVSIIDHVNRHHELLTSWTLGGGTAMMLQINHRESHDVDLFLDDPQLLPYVTAAVSEMAFKIGVPSYNSDGTRHLKIAFVGIGEIDFIVTGHITNQFAEIHPIEGHKIELETVAEIVAKKVRFRGSSLQPRDVFDIAAACHSGHEDSIRSALQTIPEYRAVADACLERLKPEYVDGTISQLMIRPAFREIAKNARSIAQAILKT